MSSDPPQPAAAPVWQGEADYVREVFESIAAATVAAGAAEAQAGEAPPRAYVVHYPERGPNSLAISDAAALVAEWETSVAAGCERLPIMWTLVGGRLEATAVLWTMLDVDGDGTRRFLGEVYAAGECVETWAARVPASAP